MNREFAFKLPKNLINVDDLKQVLRASGSVGANYIEANESLGKKDFLMRIKICKKEAKECVYWFKLLKCVDENLEEERVRLMDESTQLVRIFAAILDKSK